MSDSKKKRSVTSGGRKKRRMTDGTNKEYECDVCEKRLTRPDHLVVHQRKHTGDKHFECDVCQKIFFERQSHKTSENTLWCKTL